ncbi:MAG: FlgN protein [Firmicutes bacterium]|nr:FlgN protein [Bacillota bacterium]
MQEKLNRLTILLTELVNLYQGIVKLSESKRVILVSGGNPKELEVITKQEEILILQIAKIEKVRGSIIQEIAAEHNLDCKKITLSQIQVLVKGDAAERFVQISDKLSTIVTELSTLNEANTKLLQQAMKFVNFNINILAQNTSDPTYAPQGQPDKPAQARSFIDQKV